MLDNEVIQKLKRPLEPSRIKTRQGGGGMQLAYLKGHDAIDTANQIFGFGNWGFDLLSNELINVLSETGEILGGYYAARVKLTVAGCVPITEEGVCPIQEGRNPRAKIDAHDMARKGAITDALKRALRCYGDQFGNSLYDNEPGSDAYQATHKDQKPQQNQNQGNQQRPAAPLVQQSGQPATPQQKQSLGPVTPPTPNPATSTPKVAPAQAIQQSQGSSGEFATAQQRQGILRLAGNQGMEEVEINRRLKDLYACNLDTLSRNDAAHFIKVLQGQA